MHSATVTLTHRREKAYARRARCAHLKWRSPVIHRPATAEEFALACELRNGGVPFDEDEFERMRVDALGLSIYQNRDLPSTGFTLPSGETGYILNAVISNDSPRELSAVHIQFDGPTCGFGMCLLQDPRRKSPREYLYSFPDPRLAGFEREVVLNHLITRRRTLFPGDLEKGFLLVVGQAPLPSEYHDRYSLEVRLTVFDQKGRDYHKSFELMVERSRKEKRLIQRLEEMSKDEIREMQAVT